MPGFFHKNVTPFSESYTVAIQRELWRDRLLTASYIGAQDTIFW
jgi:hypothetical protein